MSFHWKVNGESACQSELTLDERLEPPTKCAHTTRESIEAEVARFKALYPEATVEVIEGSCQDQGGYDRYDRDEDEEWDAAFRKLGAPLKVHAIKVCEDCPFSRDPDPMPAYCAHPEIPSSRQAGYGPPPAECPLRTTPLTLEVRA